MERESKIDFVLVDSEEPDCRLALDMGNHAGKEAITTLVRVLSTVPTRDHLAASAVAVAGMLWHLQTVTSEFDKTNPGFKKAVDDIVAKHEKHLGDDFRKFAAAHRAARR